MKINQIISSICNKAQIELNKQENMDKMNNKIFKPIINNIFVQLYPYIILFSIIIITLFVLMFSILFMNIRYIYK